MTISLYRRRVIERLAAINGMKCKYCTIPVRIPLAEDPYPFDAATIDHIVPRSRGGTNAFENLALACSKCNFLKADRDLAEFLRNPSGAKPSKKLPRRRAPRFREPEPAWSKVRSGTLAHAIRKGEVDPNRLSYRKHPLDMPVKHARIENPVSLAMTQRILREPKVAKRDLEALRRIDWPWLRELSKPLVETVGFGPWK